MKAKLFACLFVVLIALLLVISCDPKAMEPSETTYSTPTIKGTVSIPEGRNISPSEIYVKVIDEEGKTVSIPKAKSDGSFVVENLIAGRKYSILFTSVEPEFTNRGISRGNESTSGVGGWLQDIVPTMVGANDIGNVKLKPLGTIKGKAETDGNAVHYDTTVYIPGTSFIAMTDEDGFFSINNVPEGTYTLRYTHEGCIPVMKDDVFLSCPDGVENPEATVGNVKLVSSYGTVEGIAKLGDSDDSSVVSIRLESEYNSIVYTSTSSREGYYVINNVQPGSYRIIASSTGYISQFSQYFTVSPATITQVSESITLFGNIGTVTGTVSLLDSDVKSGITILLIDNTSGNTFSTATDGDGNFQKIVKPGEYTVSASYPGYVSVSYRIIVTESNITDVSFSSLLPDSGTITGYSSSPEEQITVLASDGTPVNTVQSGLDCSYRFERISTGTYSVKFSKAGFASYIVTDVVVTPSTTTTVNGSPLVSSYGTISGTSSSSGETVSLLKEGVTIGSVITAEAREYSFSNIEPGTYKVRFSKEGYTSKETDDISVSGGSSLTVNGTALVSLYGTISGKSYSEGESVYLVRDGNTVKSAVTLENREYVFEGVEPGEYKVRFSKNGYGSHDSENINVAAGGSYVVDGVQLIGLYGAVAGNVVLPDTDDFSGVVITLTNSTVMTDSLTEISSADGSFRFDNITVSGTYLLTYSKDGYVKDQSKSVDVVTGSVVVAESVTLRSISATVKGTIQLEGASSHENITILLRNDTNQYTATTDQKGEYLINRIIPGTYSILASKDGYVTSTPSEVVVEPSSDKTIETRTLSVAIRSVTGKVTLELLSDYSGALVTATNLSDNTLVYSAITNSEGNFTLAGMTPGEYSVVISCNGYRTVTLPTINIVSSSTTNLPEKNMLINRGTVSGTVNLEGRSSSEGIKVELMRGSEVYESTMTDESGNYSFYVPQGNYSGVRYSKTDFASSSISRNIALFADNYVSMGDTDLKATHNTVSGKVDVLTTNNEGDVTISFDGMESITAYTTTEDGEFSFEHVPVGKYVMRFRRTDCSDITVPVNVTAADVISLGTVTITPNSATIKGTVVLKEGLSSEGVTVSIDMGGKTLQTTTDSSGRYEIGGVSIADEYTVTYSKYGWDNNTQTISPKLNLLEIREMPEISLVDTTAPVLKSVTINNGTNTTADRNVVLHIDAEEAGSGIKTMLVYDYSNPQYLGNYSSLADWTFESSNGLKTVCVKVIDRAGNESDIISAQVTLTDQKKEVKGVLKGDDLTWTKEMSPYLVTGNLLVEKDDTLIIQPGVDVQFSGNYYLQVEGKLSAIGTKDERIKIYGIDSGDNNWDGMKFINDNDSFISYTNIDGLKNGIVGYCDIDHANITSNGWAIGSASFETKENVLNGYLSYCTILGNIAAMNTSVFRNNLIGNDVFLYSTQILENSFNCINLLTRKSFSYNNTFSKVNVYSKKDVQKNNTFNSCNLFLGYDRYNNMEHSVLYNIQFNNCTFEMFAADINNSNIINCSPILIESDRTIKERFDCTGNYWGDINTVEIKSKGEGQNLSFIIDYYDDFNRTRIDYSGYKESEVEDVGYHGQEPDGPYSGYSIGDTGPAGGVVFYDKGYYSDGWRYLEASKTDIGRYVFGYYRPDGTSNNEVGTLQVIGSGKYNTERLVELMDIDGKAYSSFSGTATAEYAAKKCLDYSYGGYDDWFLPSKEELKLMYKNLSKKGLGSFANNDYWSSSEYSYSDAWTQCFSAGYQNNYGRYSDYCVRAVRAF